MLKKDKRSSERSAGPAGSCGEMGEFVRIMSDNLKRENSFPGRFGKDFWTPPLILMAFCWNISPPECTGDMNNPDEIIMGKIKRWDAA